MKLSLFSVSYAGFWGQQALDLSAFIQKSAELGYDAVMLAGKRPHVSPLDANPESLLAIKTALQKHQLTCSVIAGYTDLGPIAATEVPHLELQIAYVESLSRIAAALGADIVRVFTAYEVDGHSPQAIASQLQPYVESNTPSVSKAIADAEQTDDGVTQLRSEKGTKPRMWFTGQAAVEVEERVPRENESYSPEAYDIYNWGDKQDR